MRVFGIDVGLHEDRPGADVPGNGPEMIDQRTGNALPTGRFKHRQIIDVDLAAGLFELGQDIGRQRADGGAVLFGEQGDVIGIGQPARRPWLVRRRVGIILGSHKALGEHHIDGPQAGNVARPDAADGGPGVQTFTAVPLAETISIEPLGPTTS